MQGDPEGDPVDLTLGERRALLRLDQERVASLAIERIDTLTRRQAQTLVGKLASAAGRTLVVFKRSSPDARALLRAHRVSYAAEDGELFIFAPPVYVERPAQHRPPMLRGTPLAPFAIRASRVSRWLLLHPHDRPSFRELAREVELSEAMVSRTVRALADEGLVTVAPDPDDARRRRARVRDVAALLDTFDRAAAVRRTRRVIWDVGARDAQSALDMVRVASARARRPYAIGGLAGAAFLRRVVEPADVTLWILHDDLDTWAQELMATRARPGPGRIVAQVAPDPYVLTLASERDEVQVADPVQLYLDCRVAGERALEAAEAIQLEMGW